ncbi:uncharacterized protein LOC131163991 isoform X2 [Malania oleifera]|uniref:uncharacterized protein LOC131163991 isoform X2 n=1 Tax=Malania oleifera TaxID=397392 RepID=UPI0025ADAC21|nr:uncharacterized protein LOC131163991 isoform X2 [Malania oleifera]XP_057976883.1 uncharacterized protein LOC131163991 isoform X2 [Malania oleifera]
MILLMTRRLQPLSRISSYTFHNMKLKLKQDTEDCRVMYREGPQGTPFHTLLVEGYMDAPLDVCLCVSWESALYKKWWPQFRIPTFKIISSKCLQKIQFGEQISLVRTKLSWPLSDREAFLHYFEFEYFQDDLTIVLINSISESDSTDVSFNGFTNDGTLEGKDMVRIGMVGGFALQKVTPERSYFRTIANMDVKLDFVPPSLINFISRQLIGNGFRLYQKAVASVSKGDEDFNKALGDPLYARIRKALYFNGTLERMVEPEDIKNDDAPILPREHLIKTAEADPKDTDQKVLGNYCATDSLPERAPAANRKDFDEIEEEEINDAKHQSKTTEDDVKDTDQKVIGNYTTSEHSFPECVPAIDHKSYGEIEEVIGESRHLEQSSMEINRPMTGQIEDTCQIDHNHKVSISPAVENALETLDKIISLVQNVGFNAQSRFPYGITNEKLSTIGRNAEKELVSSKDTSCSNGGPCIEVSNNELVEKTAHDSRNSCGIYELRHLGSNSYAREGNHNRIAPASPEQNLSVPFETHQVAVCSSYRGDKTEEPIVDKNKEHNKQLSAEANGIQENILNAKKKKLKQQKTGLICCLPFSSSQVVA